MNLLHVAVVTETYPPQVNGVAMTLARMVDGLLARGHYVNLIRPRQGPDDQPRDPPRCKTLLTRGVSIPGYAGLQFGLPAPRLLARYWQFQRPDVVQVVTEGPLGASAVATARRLGIPVVSEYHTNFQVYSRHYRLGWLEGLVAAHLRCLHNRAAMTLVPSRQLAEELRQAGYHAPRVVARGVDTALFHPQRRRASLRRQWGVGADDPVVAHVGRLAAEKNLPLVFTAFEAMVRHQPQARLLLVGDGPEKAGLAQRYPQAIFAGMRHGEDLAAHYASADLFLFPSLSETYGNVTLEALASGLPVVAFRRAAAAELIRDGINGRLAEPGDAAAFVRAALDLVTRPGLCQRMAAAAAGSVAALDWERIHESLIAALREAAGQAEKTIPFLPSPYRP